MNPDSNAYYSSNLGVSAYDLFAGQGLLAGDVDYYLDCARSYGDPVLELGCGTGRITLPLADAGHDVVGLDISPAMLQLAEQKATGRHPDTGHLKFVLGDMTAFDLDEHFSLALVPARSFQHITEPELQRTALECIHRHLVPNGHLILDLFDPNFDFLLGTKALAPVSRECRDPRTGNLLRRTVIGRHVDPFVQTIREDLRFEVLDSSGQCTDHEETSWTLRWTMRQEMGYLLELTGFKPIGLYSDFAKSPPAYGREQLWVAQAI